MYWWFPAVALYQMFNGAKTKMCFARLRCLLMFALVQNVGEKRKNDGVNLDLMCV
jgi:hypothetical protein